MSQAHKGSRLLMLDNQVPVKYDSTHFNFDNDGTGISHGDIIYPQGNPVYSSRWFEGKYGGAVAVEEPSSNLLDSVISSSSTDWTKWSHYGNTVYWSGSAVIIDEDYGSMFSGISTSNTAFIYQYGKSLTVPASSAVSFSVWAKFNQDSNLDTRFYVKNATGAEVASQSNNVSFKAGQWTRLTYNNVIASEVTVEFGLSFGPSSSNTNGALGLTGYFAQPMYEQKPFCTSYIKGSRGNPNLVFDASNILNLSDGTISCWFNPSLGYFSPTIGDGQSSIIVFSTAFNVNEFSIKKNLGTNKMVFSIASASAAFNSTISTTLLSANSWCNIAATWSVSAGFLRIYINGVKEGEKTGLVSSVFPSAYGVLAVGHHAQNPTFRAANGIIDELRIDKYVASDEEIAEWYYSGVSFANPFDLRSYA
jgi:hypothetical protein